MISTIANSAILAQAMPPGGREVLLRRIESMSAAARDAAFWAGVQELAYLVAGVFFIFALQQMASPKTARRGNLVGALGMLIAIVATFLGRSEIGWVPVVIGIVLGSGIGGFLALWVKMTAMPQMVAMFNGFGGLASGVVVLAMLFAPGVSLGEKTAITTAVSSLIGWLTFTGSVVAFAKLQEMVIPSGPITFPFQKLANFSVLAACAALIVLWAFFPAWWWLVIPIALLAAVLGVAFVIPIGGADMPVVISLLNSYSGLAAAATGFVLNNNGLIIAGSLVGASGIILTKLMCQAMNRSLPNVLFGAVGKVVAGDDSGEEKRVTSWTAEDAAMTLGNAGLVIVVPGYGMAVAQAQHVIKEMADILEDQGVTVKFGIHPVAGRMPGHMNVLLAEAEVPYEKLCDMGEINPEFEQADAVLVIGANDVINPEARKEGNPISGMPILDVDKAGTVMICKRSLSPGFAGIDNPLFYADRTAMLFGDGKKMITDVVAALKSG